MMWLATPLIVLIITIVLFALCIYLILKIKQLTQTVEELTTKEAANSIIISDLQLSTQNIEPNLSKRIDSNINEINRIEQEQEQVLKQLEHRIQSIKNELGKVSEEMNLIKEQQHPKDKLYSRAYKLASLGSDVEEIMRECDLPRAEADLLLTVYQRNND